MTRLLILITINVLSANTIVSAQSPKLSDRDFTKWIENYMNNAVKFDHFAGVVLVAHKGKIIFSNAYGMANYELNVPNSLNTKFRIGSVSKTFTAAAIIKLYQQNKIHLDSSICLYLDDCPDTWKNVSVRQLLSHTSGIVSFTGLQNAKGNFLLLEHSSKEILDLFRSKPLESQPGVKYNYNNSGYFLLGLIVEKVSGISLEQYLETYFFTALQLKNTGVDKNELLIFNRASGYRQVSDSTFVNTYDIDMSNSFAIGGLYSTANDLQIWADAFYSEVLFDERTRKEILTKSPNSNYGLGWILDSIGEFQRFYHDGGITDFSTSLQKIKDYTIVAISNKGSDGGIKVAYDIAGKLFSYPATIRGIQDEMSRLKSNELFLLINKAKQNLSKFRINEKLVNEIAEDLAKQNKIIQSIEVFTLNTLLYANSQNTYLKLGEAYLKMNATEKANQNFEKCLAIDPANLKAKAYLKK